MSLDNISFDSAVVWLRHAAADLKIARYPLPKEDLYDVLCFHAQQTVEKSIKAVLVNLNISFPKTHRIKTLIDLLPFDIPHISEMSIADRLTVYAVTTRYPGITEEVTEEFYMEAMQIAEAFYEWAKKILFKSDSE